jgi:hypothetical protein
MQLRTPAQDFVFSVLFTSLILPIYKAIMHVKSWRCNGLVAHLHRPCSRDLTLRRQSTYHSIRTDEWIGGIRSRSLHHLSRARSGRTPVRTAWGWTFSISDARVLWLPAKVPVISLFIPASFVRLNGLMTLADKTYGKRNKKLVDIRCRQATESAWMSS